MLLTLADIQKRIPVSRATIYRWVATGELSLPVKVGRRSFWREADVEKLIASLPQGLSDVSAAVEGRSWLCTPERYRSRFALPQCGGRRGAINSKWTR